MLQVIIGTTVNFTIPAFVRRMLASPNSPKSAAISWEDLREIAPRRAAILRDTALDASTSPEAFASLGICHYDASAFATWALGQTLPSQLRLWKLTSLLRLGEGSMTGFALTHCLSVQMYINDIGERGEKGATVDLLRLLIASMCSALHNIHLDVLRIAQDLDSFASIVISYSSPTR